MKSLIRIGLLLLSIQWLLACSEEKEKEIVPDIDSIPFNDRFIFNKGDSIYYTSSDGSTDTVFIKDFSFWRKQESYSDMFGGMHSYVRDFQNISFECSNDKWRKVIKDYLSSGDSISHCFMIETEETLYFEGNPVCMIVNGCGHTSGHPYIAGSGVKFYEIVLNNKSYYKVYYYLSNEPNSYKIYWNLKYGIIRFEGIYNGNNVVWDLVY